MADHPATIDALLAELHQKQSVLRGWTAVLNLSEKAVQALAESRWSQSKLSFAWFESASAGLRKAAQLEMQLAPPQFTLASGEKALTIRQPIRAATLRHGTLSVRGDAPAAAADAKLDDPRVTWAEPSTLAVHEECCIAGTAPLAVVASDTDPHVRIVTLDLRAASFAHQGLRSANLSAKTVAPHLTSAIADRQARLDLVTLDLRPPAKSSALRPDTLELAVAQAKSGSRALRLLIGSAARTSTAAAVELDESIPVASGSDYSLVVDSGVIIQDLVTDYNGQAGLVKLAAVDPAGGRAAWYAQTRNPLQFEGTVSGGDLFPPIKRTATLSMTFKGSKTEGLVLSSSAGPDTNIQLELAVGGAFPMTVTGEGDEQRVRLSSGTTEVTANGVAESAVKSQLEDFLRAGVSPDMSRISFDPVTDLLLKRLDLPGHRPKILHAQLPGDLVLAGSLEAVR